jgi:peptide/nickel transport system permease protein
MSEQIIVARPQDRAFAAWLHQRKERAAYWRYVVGKSLSLQIGLVIVAFYVALAVVGQLWTPYDPRGTLVGEPFAGPGGSHFFGTDRVGSDVFSRVLDATALDLMITVAAVSCALVIGTTIGTLAGYFAGAADFIAIRFLEVFQAFPSLLLAMLVVQALGPGIENVIVVLTLVGIPYYLLLSRGEVLSKKNWQFAEAARMVGNGPLRVAFRHLLPNSVGPILAYTSINAAWVVLLAASLGFLGVGIEAGRPEWGAMISRGQPQIITGEWWISFFPGVAVLGLAAGFYLLGDGVRDVMDPRSR